MKPIFIDFETYWDQQHSLSKMPAIEYVMHPDTEIISVAIKNGIDGKNVVVFGEEKIGKLLRTIDWSDKMVVAHNMSEFDALILAYRYGVKPKMWACTMAMARPWHAKTVGVGLAALSRYYGIGEKGSLVGTNTKGKHLKDFTQSEIAAMRVYNRDDTELCAQLFRRLAPKTTPREFQVIDTTIRMLTESQFVLDADLLLDGLDRERARKTELITNLLALLGLEEAVAMALEGGDPVAALKTRLSSAAKFRALLEELEVPVPMKMSPTTGKPIPALAKTDEGFKELLSHSDERVAAAAEARLGVRSTILETRIERFLANTVEDRLPIALRYCGADTTSRWSGIMKMNQQNMPRVNPDKPAISDVLRQSLRAPPGWKVVAADESGIELRVNHFLWQEPDSMHEFQLSPDKADLYVAFAAEALYFCSREEIDKHQRQVAKIAQLGLGFGAAAQTLYSVAQNFGIRLRPGECERIVYAWREKYGNIVNGWSICQSRLEDMMAGAEEAIDPWGLCHTIQDGIQTPRGQILYPHLGIDKTSTRRRLEYDYQNTPRGQRTRIYAGKVDENIVQHLARQVLVDVVLRIKKHRLGKMYPLKHTVHDELIYIVRDEHAEEMLELIHHHMRAPVEWWPELITWSEGGIGQTYAEAK